MDFARGPTLSMSVASAISCLSSLSVIVHLSTNSKRELATRASLRVVFYIFIGDVLTSIGSIVGSPKDQSGECWFEGIVTNIFTLSCLFWSVVNIFMLYSIVVHSRTHTVDFKTHVLCWGLPVVVTFLPLINSTYGSPAGMDWCWVVDKPNSPDWAAPFWFWVSFYFWFVASLLITVYLSISLLLRYRRTFRSANDIEKFYAALRGLYGYSIIIMICWLPAFIFDIRSFFSVPPADESSAESEFTNVLSCLTGTMSAVYFWSSHYHQLKRVVRSAFHLKHSSSSFDWSIEHFVTMKPPAQSQADLNHHHTRSEIHAGIRGFVGHLRSKAPPPLIKTPHDNLNNKSGGAVLHPQQESMPKPAAPLVLPLYKHVAMNVAGSFSGGRGTAAAGGGTNFTRAPQPINKIAVISRVGDEAPPLVAMGAPPMGQTLTGAQQSSANLMAIDRSSVDHKGGPMEQTLTGAQQPSVSPMPIPQQEELHRGNRDDGNIFRDDASLSSPTRNNSISVAHPSFFFSPAFLKFFGMFSAGTGTGTGPGAPDYYSKYGIMAPDLAAASSGWAGAAAWQPGSADISRFPSRFPSRLHSRYPSEHQPEFPDYYNDNNVNTNNDNDHDQHQHAAAVGGQNKPLLPDDLDDDVSAPVDAATHCCGSEPPVINLSPMDAATLNLPGRTNKPPILNLTQATSSKNSRSGSFLTFFTQGYGRTINTINSARGGTINTARGGTINSARGGTINSARGGTINTARGGTTTAAAPAAATTNNSNQQQQKPPSKNSNSADDHPPRYPSKLPSRNASHSQLQQQQQQQHYMATDVEGRGSGNNNNTTTIELSLSARAKPYIDDDDDVDVAGDGDNVLADGGVDDKQKQEDKEQQQHRVYAF